MQQSWECHDGIFGLPDDRVLTPGVVDEDAVHVFTRGHCHSFAEAIVRLVPSAELIWAYDFSGGDQPEENVQGHVLVRIGGRYLDARGWIDEIADEAGRDLESHWSRVAVIGREGWLVNSDGWLDLRIDEAVPFAIAVLDRVGVEVSSEQRLVATMLDDAT